MLRKYADTENKFAEIFNDENGFYVRTGIVDDSGNDTNVDPFMRDMPNLIDVGIMGHCIHGFSGLCAESGIGCYQSGESIVSKHMTYRDYVSIVDQVKDHVFQIALGGRGDPNNHPNIAAILKYSRENGIVPNYTTSGHALTQWEVDVSKEYCGAVAVSQYFHPHTRKALEMFLKAGVLTNIHFVLSKKSIDKAIDMLINRTDVPDGINAVIFLLHKPVGAGMEADCLNSSDPRLMKFFEIIDNWKGDYKIGFDSCSVNMIINYTKNINMMSLDACEAARFSMYINSNMIAVPCSFDANKKWGVNLHSVTIKEAWNGRLFNEFRKALANNCPNCIDRSNCYGGCPIVPQITVCDRKEKDRGEK